MLRAKLCVPIALVMLILAAATPGFAAANQETGTTSPTATPQLPLAAIPNGTWLIGAEVSPGLYAAPGGAQCSWKRLSGFGGTSEETIAAGGGERPIVEIAQTDRGFATDSCGEWTPLNVNGDAGAPSPTPLSTETRTPTSTRRPTATAAPSPTDTAVPTPTAARNLKITVPEKWQTLADERLGYSYAVPKGWQTIDLPRIERYPLWGVIKRFFSDVSDQLTDFLKTPEGQRLGYLAVDVDMFPRPTARTIALAAVWPLDDDLPSETIVQLLPEMLGSIRQVSIDLERVEARIINNLPAIQAVGTADLRSQGLFYAHTVVTVLRWQDNAYLLAVLSPPQDDAADHLIEQIVGSFGPTAALRPEPTPTPTHTRRPPTRTPTPTPLACKTHAAVTWCVLSVTDHGSAVTNSAGHTLTPNGAENNRFIRVRFRARNESAADMEIMEVRALKLRDGQGREYEHFIQDRGRFIPSWYPDTHIPEGERCRVVVSFRPDRPRKLPPNVWTICQALFEVNADATNLVFLANALAGEPRVSVEIPLSLP
ncbi:MAG: hypothetical protein OXK78_14810 [Caldilineaceae bacterium]|nr:hypothetical protein [Caldilineaceae bacterium]